MNNPAASTMQGSLVQGSLYVLFFAIIIPGLYLLLGFALDAALHIPYQLNLEALEFLGMIFTGLGLFIISASTFSLAHHGKGLPVSSSPPQEFVKTGFYRYFRHPIYTGAIFLFGGLSVLLSSFWGLIVATPLLAVFYLSYARGIEEPVLIDRFGDEYLEYQADTPLFLPIPFRKTVRRWVEHWLNFISTIVNKPRISRFNQHLFFWGYGIWPGFGVFVGLAFMEFILLSQGIEANISALIIILMTVFSLFGVRFIWRLVTAFRTKNDYSETKKEVGFMSWGTLLGVFITSVVLIALTEHSVSILLDAILPGFLIAHFWGRIGCLFYGCCYGKNTQSGPHLHYAHPALKAIRSGHASFKKVIPVQLFSALYGLLGSLLIFALWYGNAIPAGVPAALSAIWYCSFRIDEEWLREQSVVWLHIISPAQVVAFLLMLSALVWLMVGVPAQSQTYQPLVLGQDLRAIFGEMHFLLLAASGGITALLFSYHHEEIGKWSNNE